MIPQLLSSTEAGASTFQKDKNQLMDSMATFLGQEISRFNTLLRVVKRSLENLRAAIKGIKIMSSELDSMYKAFSIL
jgi:hypothetical protein